MNKQTVLPRHVAVVMDGNGRYGQKVARVRTIGHRYGAENVRPAITHCAEVGIEILTLFAFSTENWSRPASEVNSIISMITEYLTNETKTMIANGIVLHFIGDLSIFDEATRRRMEQSVKDTAHGTGMILNIALNYGGRAEIVRAARLLAERAVSGEILPSDISEELFSQYLYTAGEVDPDLIIRTGAETRLSNFLTYQSVYSEIYFSELLWPDFSTADFDKAFEYFASRKRRFGGIETK